MSGGTIFPSAVDAVFKGLDFLQDNVLVGTGTNLGAHASSANYNYIQVRSCACWLHARVQTEPTAGLIVYWHSIAPVAAHVGWMFSVQQAQ